MYNMFSFYLINKDIGQTTFSQYIRGGGGGVYPSLPLGIFASECLLSKTFILFYCLLSVHRYKTHI